MFLAAVSVRKENDHSRSQIRSFSRKIPALYLVWVALLPVPGRKTDGVGKDEPK
jgi:hypothetical protein